MGRRKPYVAEELTFAPKISRTSKRIALRLSEHLDTKGVPRFMQSTKSKKLTLEPITSVPITSRSNKGDQNSRISPDAALLPSRPVLPSLSPDGQSHGDVGVNSSSNKHAIAVSSFVGCGLEDVKAVDPYNNAMSKNAYLPPRSLQLDESVFTFRPKVSSASAKIAESLGTDFMSRQQMHLEKQRRLLEQSSQQVRFPAHLVAQPLRRREVKEFGDFNNNALPSDGMAATVDSLNMVGESGEAPPGRDTYSSDNMRDPSHATSLGGGKADDEEPSSSGLQRLLSGPYAASAASMVLKKSKKSRQAWFSDSDTLPRRKHSSSTGFHRDGELAESLTRSKTMPTLGRPKLNRKLSTFDGERLQKAKEMVEKAIKYRKVFTIQGGYSSIRHSLRRRGWVEKFYKIPAPPKKTPRTKRRKTTSDDDDDDDADDDDDDDDDDDTDDDDNDQPKIPPWEEEDGVYGIMSRMLRNTNPSFFWVLKRDVIDYRFLSRDQMVNHYCKAGSFTTKVGLCVNMKNVPWYDESDPDQFFPRCYRLSHDEEKHAFIDDFRQTACRNILKMAVNQNMDGADPSTTEDKEENGGAVASASATKQDSKDSTTTGDAAGQSDKAETKPGCTNPACTRSRPNTTSENKCVCQQSQQSGSGSATGSAAAAGGGGEGDGKTTAAKKADGGTAAQPSAEAPKYPQIDKPANKKVKKRVLVPLRILETAMSQCELFLAERAHEDIDRSPENTNTLSDAQWDELIHWYYQLAHEDGVIVSVSQTLLGQVESLINRLRTHLPQFEMDGVQNVWIVKPGAKSRGRGITCYDRLEDMLKLVSAQVVKKDGKYVVQKYIERPLLVYNTKFDIRQWFLVTDWNPLTIWFYQDSYLRFCSQQYTLDNFSQAIHLSNNAIQKYCKNGPRSSNLPPENMWTHDEFRDYLRKHKHANAWEEIIYPGMKKAIICSLLCTQDLVEYRKASFELYGADFMLTEDLQPWLIEINSSPSMEASTSVTAKLCNRVLDDTIKVVVDRKYDRNCDIGAFELAYRQPVVTVPPYIGISLSVEGQAIKKPGVPFTRRNVEYNPSDVYLPRRNNDSHPTDVLFTPRPPARAPPSDKHGDSAPKKTSSGTVAASSSSTNGHGSTRKESNTPDNGSVSSCPPKATGASQSEASSTAVNVDGKSTSRVRVLSEGGNKTDRGELAKINSELKLPNTQNFPPTSMVYSHHTPLLTDAGNKRIISKTSVSANYPVPSSQGSVASNGRSLVVNNVESTDLKTFKPSKDKGKRRRRRHIQLGVSRYPKATVPVKLSPYIAPAIRRLPPVKVHVITPRLEPSKDSKHAQVATYGGTGDVAHAYHMAAQPPPPLPLPHRLPQPPPSTPPPLLVVGGGGAPPPTTNKGGGQRGVTQPGACSSREWVPVTHSVDLVQRLVGWSQASSPLHFGLACSAVSVPDLRFVPVYSNPVFGRMNLFLDGAWGRLCSECGSGMNLRLVIPNPKCRCQQDSLVIATDDLSLPTHVSGAMPSRTAPLRPRSAMRPANHSPAFNSLDASAASPRFSQPSSPVPQLPSGCARADASPQLGQSKGCFSPDTASAGDVKTSKMLRTPPLIQPIAPVPSVTSPLPKKVWRYYGKKERPRRTRVTLSVSLSTRATAESGAGGLLPSRKPNIATYLDTRDITMPLSIMPQGQGHTR